MHIYHVAVEMAPIAKQGGLADVIHGLPKALLGLGISIEVILPYYHFLELPQKVKERDEVDLSFGSFSFSLNVAKTTVDGVNVTLLECKAPHPFFHRNSPYGNHQEEVDSFLFFSVAALTYITHQNKKCLIHLHDWHSSIIATLVKHGNYPLIKGTVLTIHNLEFQGRCHFDDLRKVGIESKKEMRLEDPKDPTKANLLSSALFHADKITTVSQTYAKEILTHEHGWWLEGVLYANQHKLTGIINGIDFDYWNPLKDSKLHANFSSSSSHAEILEARHHNKRHLQKQTGLPLSHAPLLISITRLTPQKNPYLIVCAMEQALKLGMQYFLLGSLADEETKKMFDHLKGQKGVYMEFNFNPDLAHLAYGGADAIIIPSNFEPCGLTQLIAMRYGTIPVVRATGGLKDTVEDIEYSKLPPKYRNGFTFNEKDRGSIDWVLNRVHHTFTNEPKKWEELMMHCLKLNFSWDTSASEYEKLYQTILEK